MTTILSTWKEPGEVAIRAAWKKRDTGGGLVDALEAGLAAAELDPNLIMIGLGSLPNAEGDLELDASIMRGSDYLCGAVCAVRNIVPVISLARKVMEDTPHVMIAGEQARRYAIEQGFEPRQTLTGEVIARWEEWRESPERIKVYEHTHSDTVTMLGLSEGKMVAASSTSGLPFKQPGRVGDSPIFGAGIYADDEVGSAGATGNGEELWKAVASFRAVEFMRQGMSPQVACERVIEHMIRRQPRAQELPCVVFAMSRDGEIGAATTKDQFDLWICQDGEFEMKTFVA
ncbi:MAG: isoaspartyl peptidase/L-asparaginase [Chthonomonas sp.]|nr:isoaspartyl peptidase/L-asparaginase [Chthonomonas sp.]